MSVKLGKIGAAALGLGSALFGVWQFNRAVEESRWDSALEDGPEAILQMGQSPRIPRQGKIALADALAKGIMPPNHKLAAETLGRAVADDPLSSTLWYSLAEEEALLNAPDRARICLERSDALDPHYPEQRYGAIQLWSILGEPKRAADQAVRIAELGGPYRREAASRLLDIGVAPAEIFARMKGPKLPPADQVAVLEAIKSADPAQMEELLKRVDFTALKSPEALDAAAKIASDPLIFDRALQLWKLRRAAVEMIDDSIPAENLDLARPAFADPFFFGWQAPARTSEPSVRWDRSDPNTLFDKNKVQFVFAHSNRGRFMGAFYRLPMPADVGATFRVPVRARPANRSAVLIVLRKGGAEVARASLQPYGEDWQYLELAYPPDPKPQLVELMMVRDERKASQDPLPEAAVHVGPIQVRARRASGSEGGAP